MRKLAWLIVLVAGLGALFWVASAPQPLPASVLPDAPPDLKNGEAMFFAGGCLSCHASPVRNASFDPLSAPPTAADLRLGGGKPIKSAVGTFYPPNISPDKETGIGKWSTIDFVNAMKRGVTPDGRHLYPAFPYTSYQRMSLKDLIDLKGFLDTLPAVSAPNEADDLAFPFGLRRGIGIWKRFFLDGEEFTPAPGKSEAVNRGAYLVEGPGHCNECHTERVLFGAVGLGTLDRLTGLGVVGGLDRAHELGGAANPAGSGRRIPNITPGKGGIGGQSAKEIGDNLAAGDFRGEMVEVQKNLQMLDQIEPGAIDAIAAYLKQVPAVDSQAGAAPAAVPK
jgi:mono/diheme cytochrome c family protein